MDIEARLERIEKIVGETADQQAWMITWLDQKFNSIDQKFNSIDQRFNIIDQRFSGIDQKFSGIDQKFSGIDQKFSGIDQKFSGIGQKFKNIHERFDEMKAYVDLKHESILSDFRAFREMYTHVSQRVDRLEARQ